MLTSHFGLSSIRPQGGGYDSFAGGTKDSSVAPSRQATSAVVVENRETSAADSFNVTALVDHLWEFAEHRIRQAEIDGASDAAIESLWADFEQGIRQGFGEAKEILAELDQLDDALTLKIDSAFGEILDRIPDNQTENLGSASRASLSEDYSGADGRPLSLAQSSHYQRHSFSLNLTTEQGDEIMIRAVSEQVKTSEDAQFGQLASARWYDASANSYELLIKGELNEQERADLDVLLEQINELAVEFYQGDYATATEMAMALNISGTSLQTLDLNLQQIEQQAVASYATVSGDRVSLPQGLQPLRDYAANLVSAQQSWQSSFQQTVDFNALISQHPLSDARTKEWLDYLLG